MRVHDVRIEIRDGGAQRGVDMFGSGLGFVHDTRSGFITPNRLADALNKLLPFVDVRFGERLVRLELEAQSLCHPEEIGIERAPLSALVGGAPAVNAQIIRDVFAGEQGPIRDAILLNSAIAIAAFKGDFSLGITQQIANGYVLAQQAIDSGKALNLLNDFAKLTQELSPSNK